MPPTARKGTRLKALTGALVLAAALAGAFLRRDAHLPEVMVYANVIGTAPLDVDRIRCSKDGWHYAYTVISGTKMTVVVDGKEGPEYDATHIFAYNAGIDGLDALEGITLGTDGSNVAYTAMLGDKYVVVLNGVESEQYDELSFYSHEMRGFCFWEVVVSPDGKHLAYPARQGEKRFVVIDGVKGQGYDEILWGEFSADSAHFAYPARNKDGLWARVVDGVEAGLWTGRLDANRWPIPPKPPHPESPVRFTPHRPEWLAWILRHLRSFGMDTSAAWPESRGNYFVWRGMRSRRYDYNVEHLRFSPTGRHFAALARRDGMRFMIVDAVERSPFPFQGQQAGRNETYRDCAVYRRGDELVRVELEIVEN